ncbi:MAG: energy-coupling factor ABC transporter permease, partial [bacterium]|nr:energy-coupling factor ABC transporter permease [bacterium]
LHSLFFQHGGVLTLGANILNIAVVGCFLGYLIYKIYPTNISAAFSAFLTTMIGAFLCSVELFLSNKSPIKQTLIAMSSFHIIGGIIEAVVTFLILNLIYKVKPEIKELEKI